MALLCTQNKSISFDESDGREEKEYMGYNVSKGTMKSNPLTLETYEPSFFFLSDQLTAKCKA
jgi:hypothetical protein